jgi:hypothetical protein
MSVLPTVSLKICCRKLVHLTARQTWMASVVPVSVQSHIDNSSHISMASDHAKKMEVQPFEIVTPL